MIYQWTIVGIMLLNFVFMWLTVFTRKLEWYRSIGTFIFTFLPLSAAFFDQPRLDTNFSLKIAGAVDLLIGAATLYWTRHEFKKYGMWAEDIPKKLITSGPFKFVRHPQYLGLSLYFVGWWSVWAGVYAFYSGLFILAMLWIEAFLEEKFILTKKFGEEYVEYKKKTGMFFIKKFSK